MLRKKNKLQAPSGRAAGRCFAVAATAMLVAGLGSQAIAPATSQESSVLGPRRSMVRDWSDRHVLFTNGGAPATVAASQRDPRLLHNWLYRNAGLLGSGRIPQARELQETTGWERGNVPPNGLLPERTKNRRSKIDWAVSLGPTGGMPLAESPAKFSFDITQPPDCTNDTPIGPNTTGIIWDGDFDNAYYATGPSGGSLYACGTQTAAAGNPALYTISFAASGAMNTTPAMSNDVQINGATNPAGTCSPLTEFFDGTNDRLFAGVGAYGATTGANLMTMWNIKSRITSNATLPTATATNELGGTSGVIIDNASSSLQAASIYFGTLAQGAASSCGANLFCAVKLTQSGLQ